MEVKVQQISSLLQTKNEFANKRKRIVECDQKSILLLDKTSIHLEPGTVTALMGLGKSNKCLLECISLRKAANVLDGKMLYDGDTRNVGIYKDIVLINDIGIVHFESLTVFEYLYFGARLRVICSTSECRERARLAARLVGIDGGVQIGQLSTADVRILSIAAELVGNPTLVCLTNPTEGLDAVSTLRVLRVLYKIAKRISMPTTIVYTLSSVCDDMVLHIDNLHIFVGCNLEYTCKFNNYTLPALLEKIGKLIMKASLVIMAASKNENIDILKSDYQYDHVYVMALFKVIEDMNKLRSDKQQILETNSYKKSRISDKVNSLVYNGTMKSSNNNDQKELTAATMMKEKCNAIELEGGRFRNNSSIYAHLQAQGIICYISCYIYFISIAKETIL